MSVIEKALAAALKDIGTAFYTIDAEPALGPLREYSIAKKLTTSTVKQRKT